MRFRLSRHNICTLHTVNPYSLTVSSLEWRFPGASTRGDLKPNRFESNDLILAPSESRARCAIVTVIQCPIQIFKSEALTMILGGQELVMTGPIISCSRLSPVTASSLTPRRPRNASQVMRGGRNQPLGYLPSCSILD